MQTQLNASSSNWTVAYSSTTYKFTISNSGSVTLRLSENTNGAWDTLGYVSTIDATGTSFVADEQRNHTSESIFYDFGDNPKLTFCTLHGPQNEKFTISSGATITIKANNINNFSNPPLSETLTVYDDMAMAFFNEDLDGYRYWKIEIEDKLNANGPQFSIGNFYLGDHLSLSRNISNGFQYSNVSLSTASGSESGVIYVDRGDDYGRFENTGVKLIEKEDIESIMALFAKVGLHEPFYFSLDPDAEISNDSSVFTKYVTFLSNPVFTHVLAGYYNVSISMRENY
jgi:hypothetical protein